MDTRTDDELLAARQRCLTRVVRATSHDLRGACSSLAIHTALLEGSIPELTEAQQRSFSALRNAQDRLLRVAEAFFTMVPVKPTTTTGDVDLARVAADVVAALEPFVRERRVGLALDIPRGAVRVPDDAGTTRQRVFQTALDGVEQCPSGGNLTLSLTVTGERARLALDTPEPVTMEIPLSSPRADHA